MSKFYISYSHPYQVITDGDVYLSNFERYHYSGIKIGFTEEHDDAAAFSDSLKLKVLVRYLNIKFRKGIPKKLIKRSDFWGSDN